MTTPFYSLKMKKILLIVLLTLESTIDLQSVEFFQVDVGNTIVDRFININVYNTNKLTKTINQAIVTDILGHEVFNFRPEIADGQSGRQDITVDLSGMTLGVYIVAVTSERGTFSQPILLLSR